MKSNKLKQYYKIVDNNEIKLIFKKLKNILIKQLKNQ